jgi:glycosyltransferase involved in cell wall biosynthesis
MPSGLSSMEGKYLMKKIVTINHYGVTPDMPGPTKNYEMSKFFADHNNCKSEFWICGYSHYVGKMDASLGGFKLQSKKQTDNFSLIKIKSTPYRKNSLLRQLNITVFDLMSAIKILFSKDIDYIIITTPPVTIFTVIAAKLKNIKLVADVEDLWPLFLEDMGMKNKIAIKYMNFAADYLYSSADGVAAVSKGMLNYVKNKVDLKPMWISPLGVNTESYFNKTSDSTLIENKEWKNDFKIMYLGVHGKANDLFSVLNTIKFFNNNYDSNVNNKKVSFIFIGDGEQKSNLIQLAKSLDLKNVYFEDPVPGDLVPDYLVHADICLTNLMKIESFKLVRPNKLFQYMALGKPIISGIWGEFQEIIEDVGSGVYIDFNNYEEASYKLHELISNKELLKVMGDRGIDYIERYGDRKKIFSAFYKHLVEEI